MLLYVFNNKLNLLDNELYRTLILICVIVVVFIKMLLKLFQYHGSLFFLVLKQLSYPLKLIFELLIGLCYLFIGKSEFLVN